MKGDRVEVVVDAGDGSRTYEVVATRAGRRVEVVNRRGLVEVTELTRGGAAGRAPPFMASPLVAPVRPPAPRRGGGRGAGGEAGGTGRRAGTGGGELPRAARPGRERGGRRGYRGPAHGAASRRPFRTARATRSRA